MLMQKIIPGFLVLSLILPAADSMAIGPGDLKKKAEKKAKEAAEKAQKKAEGESTPSPESAPEAEGSTKGSTDEGTVSTVSTKFDFVPGNKVILMDDFTRDELGEFPSRWKARRGNLDIVEFKGERWLRLNGQAGMVSLKADNLPEKWTLEFDTYDEKMSGPAIVVGGVYENSDTFVWYASIGHSRGIFYNGPDGVTSVAEAHGGISGRHHISVMASGTSLKIYADRERLVNIPEMTLKPDQKVAALAFQFTKYETEPMIANVRFAEGGKEKLDLLATPFVTQGIVFDSGSDRLKPESAPVLRQVSTYLKENAEVAITITGHTDDVGDTAANLTLSEKRSAAVAASLSTDFGIDASRLSTFGKGESLPIAPNDSPEGKATNRRVEFAKK